MDHDDTGLMKRSARREGSRLLAARMVELPAEKRGALILFLFGNALATLALQCGWLVFLFRAGRTVVRQGDYRPGPMLRTAWSPALGIITGLLIIRRLSGPTLLREMDRWTSKEMDHNAN